MSLALSSVPAARSARHSTWAIALAATTVFAACGSEEVLDDGDSQLAEIERLMPSDCSHAEVCARSRFVPVLGSYMHYREAGHLEGPPIVLLHGQPTWSYLYRNIIPRLPPDAHIIAPDSIGYGFSGRPDIPYTWTDHVEYIEAFIEALDLHDVVLVVHDMGSFQGLAYAQRHPENVRGIVMMESVALPLPPLEQLGAMFPPDTPGAKFVEFLTAVRTDPSAADSLIVDANYFIEELLSSFTVRQLSSRELAAYRYPFRTRARREKLKTIPLGLPLGGDPADNFAMVSSYAGYLMTSDVPKLILYAEPGIIFNQQAATQLSQLFRNTTIQPIGAGLHFLQEDQPVAIATAISEFFTRL